MRFHVLGDEEVVIGFRFVGIDGSVCVTRAEAAEAFRKATSAGDIKVLIVTEQVSALIAKEVMDWQYAGAFPLIVELPGIEGHVESRKSLVDSIREAVGVHV